MARGGAARKSRPVSTERLAVTSGSAPDKINVEDVEANSRGPLKVLFLSADTGGGHRGRYFVECSLGDWLLLKGDLISDFFVHELDLHILASAESLAAQVSYFRSSTVAELKNMNDVKGS